MKVYENDIKLQILNFRQRSLWLSQMIRLQDICIFFVVWLLNDEQMNFYYIYHANFTYLRQHTEQKRNYQEYFSKYGHVAHTGQSVSEFNFCNCYSHTERIWKYIDDGDKLKSFSHVSKIFTKTFSWLYVPFSIF